MIDPRHSRPLDVHRWSDHPEVRAICDHLWASAPFQEYHEDGRTGPKPKRRVKDQLRVLLLDLYVAWKTDTTLSIGVSMGVSEWKTSSRYNALHLSKWIPALVHKLHDANWIELSKGSYKAPGSHSNRTTRIIAADALVALFVEHDVALADLEPPRERELIILRDANNKDIEYEDSPEIDIKRAVLRRYNEMLWSSFIDLPTVDEPIVTREIKEGPRKGLQQRIAIGGNDFAVRRVFSRGRWDCNGRFFGGWWQQMSKDVRRQIHINGESTVEVDFKGLHIAILSKEQGHPMVGDPYAMPGQVFPEQIQDQRAALKQLVLTSINAKSAKAAYQAFREGQLTGSPEASLKNAELSKAIDQFIEKHPHLKQCLFADQGIRLMHLDSEVARVVIQRLTHSNIPVLSIHDSFIVQAQHLDRLQHEMAEASAWKLGGPFKTETTRGHRCHNPEYDGLEPHPAHLVVAEGYKARLAAWRRRSAEARRASVAEDLY